MNPKWIQRFSDLAIHIAQWSKDPSTKVGAVIANHQRRIVSTGYNGFPTNIKDLEVRLNDRDLKYRLVIHAETNAILNAEAIVRGAVMFTTKYPCTDCAKLIIQSGISELHSPEPTPSRFDGDPWPVDAEYARAMFDEAGVLIGHW